MQVPFHAVIAAAYRLKVHNNRTSASAYVDRAVCVGLWTQGLTACPRLLVMRDYRVRQLITRDADPMWRCKSLALLLGLAATQFCVSDAAGGVLPLLKLLQPTSTPSPHATPGTEASGSISSPPVPSVTENGWDSVAYVARMAVDVRRWQLAVAFAAAIESER